MGFFGRPIEPVELTDDEKFEYFLKMKDGEIFPTAFRDYNDVKLTQLVAKRVAALERRIDTLEARIDD